MKRFKMASLSIALAAVSAVGVSCIEYASGCGSPPVFGVPLVHKADSPAADLALKGNSDDEKAVRRAARVVDYQIDAHLNPDTKVITAKETLTYHNASGRPLDVFPFHLYLNAFQPKSTWMKEARRDSVLAAEYNDRKYFGSITVTSFAIDGLGDFSKKMESIARDDGNAEDHTVFQVHLPKPVPPGENITFQIGFQSKLPSVVARTGYRNNFIMAGQWFPKVGVWWHDAWNCHQFHYATEFFADFGTFDVKLTVPKTLVVGATGKEVAKVSNSDGTITSEYRIEDVHDFAWAADPGFVQVTDMWTSPSGHKVDIKLLLQPQHSYQADRHLLIVKQSFDRFDRWYGAYPYDTLTIIDPQDFGPGGTAGGMEYPTLITGDTVAGLPRRILGLPEVALEHEFGHQYWYGMVASNEFEDPWLDEGINSYTEKVMDDLYGKDTSIVNNWFGLNVGEHGYQRWVFLSGPQSDPIVRRGWEFLDRGAYARTAYAKTAVVLATLEGIIGEEKLQDGLRVYFTRYRFTHPSREDFLQTIEEVSGTNLRWYFDQAVYGTQVLDYEVRKISAERLNSKTGSSGIYRNQVVLQRKGDFVFPVTVQIRFSNGEILREHWDGKERWVRYMYDKPVRIESAEIDPDHKVFLDVDILNNSKVLSANSVASNKISIYWLFVTQYLSQWLA
jgi:hypothetical protein